MSVGNARLSVKMASSIFLQPVEPALRTVYLAGHNTSSAQNIDLAKAIRRNLESMGYRIVDTPSEAHYMLMWNILYIGEDSEPYLVKQAALHTVQGALVGGAAGAVVGAAAKTDDIDAGGRAGALIGAGVGALTGAYLSSNHYMMVVDIQAQERESGAGAKPAAQAAAPTSSGGDEAEEGKAQAKKAGAKSAEASAGAAESASAQGWGVYHDRVVAEATGLRLNFPYIQPALVKETAGAIAGLF